MKNSIIQTIAIFAITLILASCSMLPTSRSVSDSQMQTEIVQILTAMVTETAVPILEATATEGVAMPTEQPTQSTETSGAPTVEIGQLATSTPGEQTFDSTPAPLPDEGNPPGTLEPIPTSQYQQGTPTLALTQPATDPILTLGEPTWKDTFDNGNNWGVGVNEFVDSNVDSGSLQMLALTTKNGWILSNQKVANFYVQLTGKMSTCTGTDNYGLFLRSPSISAKSGYLFGISCDGKYAFREWNLDTMTVLRNWTSNAAILKGSNQVNRLGVMAKGSELKLYVNGVLIDTIKDKTFSQGYIGLYIGRKETKNLTSILDEISIWSLP